MHPIVQKLHLVFLPYFIIAISSLILFPLLTWILIIKLGFHIDDTLINVLIPCFLATLAIIIVLRKRIHVLDVGWSNGRGYSFYQLIALCAICFPTYLLQNIVSKASYPLIAVNSVDEIDVAHPSRYYTIKSGALLKTMTTGFTYIFTTGKYGTTLNFALYLACPIVYTDSFTTDQKFWYTMRYSDNIPSRESEDKKNAVYESLKERSLPNFKNARFGSAYYENIPDSKEREGFYRAISRINNLSKDDIFIFQAVYEPFEERYASASKWLWISFLLGNGLFFSMICFADIRKVDLEKFYNGTLLEDSYLDKAIRFAVPIKPHIETSILIDLVFAYAIYELLIGVNLFSPFHQDLHKIGSVSMMDIANSEYWRLLSSLFLHAGPLHLINNIVALGLAGYLLEPFLKRGWVWLTFFITGVCATLISFIWLPDALSVGASAGIFGLFGLIIPLLVRQAIPGESRLIYYGLASLFICADLVIGLLLPEVNNAAHVAGLILGTVLGIFIPVIKPQPTENEQN